MFVNPLDRLPQVPADWANHIVYGGVLGVAIGGALTALEVPYATECATEAVLAVASIKKLVDYFKEGESVGVCVGKAFVTAVWPFSIAILNAVGAQ